MLMNDCFYDNFRDVGKKDCKRNSLNQFSKELMMNSNNPQQQHTPQNVYSL